MSLRRDLAGACEAWFGKLEKGCAAHRGSPECMVGVKKTAPWNRASDLCTPLSYAESGGIRGENGSRRVLGRTNGG